MKLTIDDIEVPAGMLEATATAWFGYAAGDDEHRSLVLASALLWLAQNPIVPSEEYAEALKEQWVNDSDSAHHADSQSRYVIREFQRRMFLRKTAALPDEVKKLLYDIGDESNKRIISAYEIGKEGK